MTARSRRPGAEDRPLPIEHAASPPAGAIPAGDTGRLSPLAARMRPRALAEFVGQSHLLASGGVLRSLIEEDRLRSVLLWGPAGTGKTTLAHLAARHTSAEFIELSAVTAGVADVRRAVEQGRSRLQVSGRRTILFVDEVHRFSRTQQDALLPGVEDGAIVFVGATTENPYSSVTTPLLSRSLVFRLEALGPQEVAAVLDGALADAERGLGNRLTLAGAAREEIVLRAGGDARTALNALEASADRASARGAPQIEREDVLEAMRDLAIRYDRAGDAHYDVASAFIKSVRGSDPDAALAWLARMIRGGEDPRFIARRLVILASEDVGLADPHALPTAVAAAHAVDAVGLPEARYALAHATVYLALAPKSNAVARAIGSASADLEERGQGSVPAHLRSASAPGGKALGYGEGYKYAHDFPGGVVEQDHFPHGIEAKRYWVPEPDLDERRERGRARPAREEG